MSASINQLLKKLDIKLVRKYNKGNKVLTYIIFDKANEYRLTTEERKYIVGTMVIETTKKRKIKKGGRKTTLDDVVKRLDDVVKEMRAGFAKLDSRIDNLVKANNLKE